MIAWLALTGVVMGAAAFAVGRALALGWQPLWLTLLYAGLLAFADRFLHFALFEAPLADLPGLAGAALYLVVIALLTFRHVRASLLVRQYPWLYRKRHFFAAEPIPTSPESPN